jgi:hypothetical protein
MSPSEASNPGAPAQPDPAAATSPLPTPAPPAPPSPEPSAAESEEEALWSFGQTHALGSGLLGGWSMTGFGGSFATESWREAEVRRQLEDARRAAAPPAPSAGPDHL